MIRVFVGIGVLLGLGFWAWRTAHLTVHVQLIRLPNSAGTAPKRPYDYEIDDPELGESGSHLAPIIAFPNHDHIGA